MARPTSSLWSSHHLLQSFRRWRRAGVWDQIMDALAAGHDAAVQMIDTSIVRVHQHGACVTDNNHQDMGRSRGGLTSKIHAVVDTNGLPVHLALTPGEAHDNRLCSVLLSALLPRTMLLADRGYDADWIRELARQQGAWANIPPKRNRKDPICFSPYLYRARNLIERFFNKIKQCRRVATRYDKLAANYLATIATGAAQRQVRPCPLCHRKRKQTHCFSGFAAGYCVLMALSGHDSSSETGASNHALRTQQLRMDRHPTDATQ